MQTLRDCKEDATSVLGPEPASGGTGASRASSAPGRLVLVEVCLIGCRPDGTLTYRCADGRLGGAENPDEAAARIGLLPAESPDPAVTLHSTSWRHLSDGSVVLTYVVAPDPDPGAPATPILSFELAHGPHPGRPSPERLRQDHVAAHAVRHLAHVSDVNPQVRLALSADPALSDALAGLARAPAGQLT